jgi:hypothetical protein
MNSISERFVLSARFEALDNFVILNQVQIEEIPKEYIFYYNNKRPHQGIDQQVPNKYKFCKDEKVVKLPIL